MENLDIDDTKFLFIVSDVIILIGILISVIELMSLLPAKWMDAVVCPPFNICQSVNDVIRGFDELRPDIFTDVAVVDNPLL